MSDFEDLVKNLENSDITLKDLKKKKKKRHSEPKSEVSGLESFANKNAEPKKPKFSLFKKNKSQEETPAESPVEQETPPNEWVMLTPEDVEVTPKQERTEDIVNESGRVIGKVLTTKVPVNEIKDLDLSISDKISQTLKYKNEEKEELARQDARRKQLEIDSNHITSLKNFLYTNLRDYLTSEEQILELQIDSKFEPYLPVVIREMELSYHVTEIPRNMDIVKLGVKTPFRYQFRIRVC